MKYKVICVNKNYDGKVANCDFRNGIAHVDSNSRGALNYFYSSDNYNVVDKSMLDDMDYQSLKSYANQLGIKFIGMNKEEIKMAVLESEGR